MIRSSLLRRGLVLPMAIGLVAAGLGISAAGPAQAEPVGALSFFSGVNDLTFNSQEDTFSFQTDGACPRNQSARWVNLRAVCM